MDYFELRCENPADNKRYFYQLDGEGFCNELAAFMRLASLCGTVPEIAGEVAGEPATLIEYGQTDAIFTSPVDSRTEDYITGRFG